ncbi:MAG: hypothetical protein MJK12_00335 [Colwellia sp.]|nr:hypothetical protein [Colwellia sp.]
MRNSVIVITTLILVMGCVSKPPQTDVERKWGVTEEGNWEEEEVHSTTIYSSEDNKLPELKLPTDKKTIKEQ